MLENAGAIVYTPRERDWQKKEVIVDNDTPHTSGEYSEIDGKHNWKTLESGFANTLTYLTDSLNPFVQGTCRMAKAQSSNSLMTNGVFCITNTVGGCLVGHIHRIITLLRNYG